ncbi:hypothetical protein D3C80_1682770 [compost metagenome]
MQPHDGRVAIERRFKIDNFIAWMHQSTDRGVQPFAGAGGDQHFRAGVIARAVKGRDFIDDTLFKGRQTGHRRILVMTCFHRTRYASDQVRVTGKVGRALRKIDGIVLG